MLGLGSKPLISCDKVLQVRKQIFATIEYGLKPALPLSQPSASEESLLGFFEQSMQRQHLSADVSEAFWSSLACAYPCSALDVDKAGKAIHDL